MLDIISGFASPGQGEVTIDRKKLVSLSRREISRAISLVSQDYAIDFPFSVQDVVLMGRHPYIDRFSRPSATDVDLAESAMDRTGVYHLKDRKITELSGGEKQRCVFARALCQDSPVLLLDEAFSNMDISHTIQLIEILRKEVNGRQKTVIAVLHDLNLAAAWSDSILFLTNGRVNCYGDTLSVFTSDNIQSVFNVSAKVEYNDFARAKQACFRGS